MEDHKENIQDMIDHSHFVLTDSKFGKIYKIAMSGER
jgi:hypothetical protein